MPHKFSLQNHSFLIYGLGLTGLSVIKYFEKKKIHNFSIWDDNKYIRKKINKKSNKNIRTIFKEVDYIILSPGINLEKSKFKNYLIKYNKKIITDLDLFYLTQPKIKTIMVTGSNGKSTTCKILLHMLKKNNFNAHLGGNIGTPLLNLNLKKNSLLVIEASSFQLAYSKFVRPNYAILLNISNDHLDWHKTMENYLDSKMKIFRLQNKDDYALLDKNFQKKYKKKRFLGKLVLNKFNLYKKIKKEIKSNYLKLNINDENMAFAYSMAKILKITKKSFINSMKSFTGLPHRFEIFMKKKNITFINDSKSTSFRSAEYALNSCKNIFWILGGLPKKNDKIKLTYLRKNIIHSYIIGKNTNFFKKQLKHKISFTISNDLNKALKNVLIDIGSVSNKKDNTVLFSPGAASFDQFKNFEERGNYFKKLTKKYVKKFF